MNIEIIKITIQAITPIAVVVLGIFLLRKVESIKSEVAKSSEFASKWAGEFWITCQEFMRCTERYMAILNQLGFSHPNNETVIKCQKECTELSVKLTELELRIRRMVAFSPKNAEIVTTPAKGILSMLSSALTTGKGNFDDLFSIINSFNMAARDAHAEMIGIKANEIKSESKSGQVF
jgi:hypothetical protein